MLGRQVSHYRILSRIGKGGMGEVYLADDLTLSRKVALKFILPPQAGDETARRRLLHEAHAAASLDHPFICKVYEVGESGGAPFIAIEYIEGMTLGDRLSAGPLPQGEAIRIASEIADALDYAHKRDIVHRDLKPSNVMLTPDGHVKVMDFGVAKRIVVAETVTGPSAPPTGLTSSGLIVGTPSYMSPEQLRGQPTDARTDVFAFGLLLFEMLTATHPYRRASDIETAGAILSAPEPELPSKDAPEALNSIIRRCLAKDRGARYQSLRDVRVDLDALARVEFSRRRGRSWAVAGIAAAVVIAALAGMAWRWPDAFRIEEPALAFQERDWILIADFENLTGDPVFDQSLKPALEIGIAQSQYVNVFPRSRVREVLGFMQKKPDTPLDEALASEVAAREAIRGVVAGSITQIGGTYSITARLIDPRNKATVRTASEQSPDKPGILPALDRLVTQLRRDLGESRAALSQTAVPLPRATTASIDALKLYVDSYKRGGGGTGPDSQSLLKQALAIDPDFALAHAELGRRYYESDARETRTLGEQHFVKALALQDRLSVRERLWIHAVAEDSRGRRQLAVDGYRNYLARYPDDGPAWFRMGWTLMAGLKKYEEGAAAFQRLLVLNPKDVNARINLATCLTGSGKDAEARVEYEKAFAQQPSSILGVFVNHEYGFTLARLGELDAAAAVFRKMAAEADSMASKARGHRSQGLLEMYRGRYGAAIEALQKAVLINTSSGGSVTEYRDRLFLARAFEGKGKRREMLKELDVAGGIAARRSLGPEWIRFLVRLEARAGRLGQAKKAAASIPRTMGDATADSSISRNMDSDQAHANAAAGEIALAEGRGTDALALFEHANLIEGSGEALEGLAQANALAGRFDEAARRYEALIAERPLGIESQDAWLRAHVRLGEVYERLGRRDAARASYSRLIELWKHGDSDLILLKEARQRLAALGR